MNAKLYNPEKIWCVKMNTLELNVRYMPFKVNVFGNDQLNHHMHKNHMWSEER